MIKIRRGIKKNKISISDKKITKNTWEITALAIGLSAHSGTVSWVAVESSNLPALAKLEKLRDFSFLCWPTQRTAKYLMHGGIGNWILLLIDIGSAVGSRPSNCHLNGAARPLCAKSEKKQLGRAKSGKRGPSAAALRYRNYPYNNRLEKARPACSAAAALRDPYGISEEIALATHRRPRPRCRAVPCHPAWTPALLFRSASPLLDKNAPFV